MMSKMDLVSLENTTEKCHIHFGLATKHKDSRSNGPGRLTKNAQ